MKKQIVCPVCEGKGFVHWFNNTETTCSTWSKTCPHCNGAGTREEPMTNGDRIRATTDEELAGRIVMATSTCGRCPAFDECEIKYPSVRACKKEVVNWLKQPAEEK